jgi:membrane-bound lytic murein transglycosylase D
MTRSHRSYLLFAILLQFAFFLSGCAASRSQSFTLSFLPSAPAVPPTPALEEPPAIGPSMYSSDTPNLIEKSLALIPPPSDAEARVKRAEQRFETGKKLYQQGDTAGARQEFDRALDVLLAAAPDLHDRQRVDRKIDQLVDAIYRYDLEGLGSGLVQQSVIYDKPPFDDILQMTFPTDPNLKPKVKEEIQATVSQLPLEENDSVLSYIHYFSTDRGHKTLVAGLKKAGRYRPLIQHILDEEGLPQELIYLAQIESGFLPRAQSYKKAVGMWQFVQFRGREYGLMQTPTSDDRMDPEKATRAAARHLRDLYTQFGDWYLAMSAYNCGPGCVDRAVQRTGFADFWQLRNLNVLPKDTMNYVPVILAVTIMAKNPKDYALEDVDPDPPVDYDTVALHCPTNLALVADALDKTVSELVELNPALLKPVAPAGYQLHIPKGSTATLMAAIDNVPEGHRGSWRMHRVQAGETIAEIAKRYATLPAAIAQANNSMAALPEAGDLLIVPASYPPARNSSHVATSRPGSRRRASSSQVAASRPAADKVMHHRAGARTYKTASVPAGRAHSAN